MFKNYMKIALRNLLKFKVYSFINISGLAIGMACCVLILLYVQDELSYDKYHQNADRIYRFVTDYEHDDRCSQIRFRPHRWVHNCSTIFLTSSHLSDFIPEVKTSC